MEIPGFFFSFKKKSLHSLAVDTAKLFIGCLVVIDCWHGGFKWVPKTDFKVNVQCQPKSY